MNLPPLTLPKVPIPFEIADMLHPMVVHFAIALPVVVLLLEIINLFVKKRAIGVVSFLLLLIGSVTVAISYLTGNVDASLMSSLGTSLQEHQILGAYLVVLSIVVLGLKLISALWKAGIIKALYLMLLALFVAGIVRAGVEGMQFVYYEGINVKKVQTLQKRFDVKNAQAQKLDSAYKMLSKEKEELKAKLQELTTQNEKMKQQLKDVTVTQYKAEELKENIDKKIDANESINKVVPSFDNNITKK